MTDNRGQKTEDKSEASVRLPAQHSERADESTEFCYLTSDLCLLTSVVCHLTPETFNLSQTINNGRCHV